MLYIIAFVVLVAFIVNYSMIVGHGDSIAGCYLELVAIVLLTITVGYIVITEKRKKK